MSWIASFLALAGTLWVVRRLLAKPTRPAAQLVNLKDLLYSQPSLSDELPPSEPVNSAEGLTPAAVMHEDDWLQHELRPRAAQFETGQLLERGEAFVREHRSGLGFRDVFIHHAPALTGPRFQARRTDLEAIAGHSATPYVLLTGGGQVRRVVGGFMLELAEVGYVYGVDDGTELLALGFAIIGPAPQHADLSIFRQVAARADAEMIDWYQFRRVDPAIESDLRAYLAEQASDGGLTTA